jgi:hypothetical protein
MIGASGAEPHRSLDDAPLRNPNASLAERDMLTMRSDLPPDVVLARLWSYGRLSLNSADCSTTESSAYPWINVQVTKRDFAIGGGFRSTRMYVPLIRGRVEHAGDGKPGSMIVADEHRSAQTAAAQVWLAALAIGSASVNLWRGGTASGALGLFVLCVMVFGTIYALSYGVGGRERDCYFRLVERAAGTEASLSVPTQGTGAS